MRSASIPLYIPPAYTYFVTTKQEGQYLSILYISKLPPTNSIELENRPRFSLLCIRKIPQGCRSQGVRGGRDPLNFDKSTNPRSQPGEQNMPTTLLLNPPPSPNFQTFLRTCEYISRLHVILYILPPLDVRLNTTILNTKLAARRFAAVHISYANFLKQVQKM